MTCCCSNQRLHSPFSRQRVASTTTRSSRFLPPPRPVSSEFSVLLSCCCTARRALQSGLTGTSTLFAMPVCNANRSVEHEHVQCKHPFMVYSHSTACPPLYLVPAAHGCSFITGHKQSTGQQLAENPVVGLRPLLYGPCIKHTGWQPVTGSNYPEDKCWAGQCMYHMASEQPNPAR